jgi:hypothetical protein
MDFVDRICHRDDTGPRFWRPIAVFGLASGLLVIAVTKEGEAMGETKIMNGAQVTMIPVDTRKINDQLEREAAASGAAFRAISKLNDRLEPGSGPVPPAAAANIPSKGGYAVTKIKTFRGRDGHGLNATLTRDGKAIAFVLDEGCGGMMRFDWDDRNHGESTEETLFRVFIASLPPDPEDKSSTLSPETLQQFAMERWVNAEVDRITNAKRFRKACKTKTLFQVGDDVGGDEFRCINGVAPHINEYLRKKYAGQKLRILNEEFK